MKNFYLTFLPRFVSCYKTRGQWKGGKGIDDNARWRVLSLFSPVEFKEKGKQERRRR